MIFVEVCKELSLLYHFQLPDALLLTLQLVAMKNRYHILKMVIILNY